VKDADKNFLIFVGSKFQTITGLSSGLTWCTLDLSKSLA